jgi:hypothetical protein
MAASRASFILAINPTPTIRLRAETAPANFFSAFLSVAFRSVKSGRHFPYWPQKIDELVMQAQFQSLI